MGRDTSHISGRLRQRMSDTILGFFYDDSLRAQRFQTLITSLFKDRCVSIKYEVYSRLENTILRFLAQNIVYCALALTVIPHFK